MRAGGRDSVPGSAAETGAAACRPLARRRRQEATAALRGAEATPRPPPPAPTHGPPALAAPAAAPPPAPARIARPRVTARPPPLPSAGLPTPEIARPPLHQRETPPVHVPTPLRKPGATSHVQAAAASTAATS